MATSSSPNYEPPPKQEAASATKRLSDLLREKQEPFVLEVYLLERRPRYHPLQKSPVSEGRFKCNNVLSTEKKCTIGGGFSKLERRRTIVSASFKCSRIAKAILNKVVSVNEMVLVKSYVAAGLEIKDGKKMQTNSVKKGEQETLEEMEGSTISSTDDNSSSTEVQTRSGSVEIEEVEVTSSSKEQMNQVLAANKEDRFQWRAVEENKDCSPVSVLDPVEPVHVNNSAGVQFNSKQNYHKILKSKQTRQEVTTISSPISNLWSFPKKVVTKDCSLSASLWELLVRSRRENSSTCCALGSTNPQAYSINSKKVKQQSRQLMFDCVREAVETTRAKKKQRKNEDVEEKGQPEEIGIKSSCGSKESGKELTRLIRSELVGSFEKWWGYDLIWKEIGMEVGDTILEEIKDELVQEMVDSFHCNDVG